jgi:superfamily II DNA or RNA helicase
MPKRNQPPENENQNSKRYISSYLGSMGYTIFKESLDPKVLKKVYRDLYVQPLMLGVPVHVKPPKFKLYQESAKKIYIPKYYGIQEFGVPKKIIHNHGTPIDLEFKGSLRPKQMPIVNSFLQHCGKPEGFGGIISVPCGWGKTVMSIYIISQLKLKTVIFVHKEFLMDQFKGEIETFLPGAKLGRIQGKTIDVEGKDIVLAMIQSVAMKTYDNDLFKDFGLSIYDECHHIGAGVFCKCPRKAPTKYTLGLSATPDRKDGLRRVFEWYIGEMVHEVKERDDTGVDVELVQFKNEDEDYLNVIENAQSKPNRPRMITQIADFGPRRFALCSLVKECYDEGRQTLILSDRKSLLTYIYEWCASRQYSVGYYVGGMKQEDLNESAKKKIIVSTFAMSSEGMNIKSLNTLILATPKSDIVQSVGRILRLKPEERTIKPKVIDFIDPHDMFDSALIARRRFYRRNGYNIDIYNWKNGKKEYVGKDEPRRKKPKKAKKELWEINECLID